MPTGLQTSKSPNAAGREASSSSGVARLLEGASLPLRLRRGGGHFGGFDEETAHEAWLADHLDGPLLDVGAGAGRDALHFQRELETVALEHSRALVTLMDERGVENSQHGDMFALPEQFGPGRFGAALVRGTQLGLAKSMVGIRAFLDDLAHVTSPDATAVVDCYDPSEQEASNLLGYRADPAPGLAFRLMSFEYDGDIGETLLFRLFSPDRLQEATRETAWSIGEFRHGEESSYYMARLKKGNSRSG